MCSEFFVSRVSRELPAIRSEPRAGLTIRPVKRREYRVQPERRIGSRYPALEGSRRGPDTG